MPPKTPSAAPDIISRIITELPTLPAKLSLLGDYITTHVDQVSFMTVRQLAAAAMVSEATIMRFVGHFGFAGYSEFLAEIRAIFSASQRGPGAAGPGEGGGDFDDLGRLADSWRHGRAFVDLANQIAAATQVAVICTPEALADGYRLHWKLSRLRPGVFLGPSENRLAKEQLASLPDSGLVLALALDHSSLEVRDLAAEARRLKLPVYLLSRSPSCSIAEFSTRHIVLEGRDPHNLAMPLAVEVLSSLAAPLCHPRYQEYQARLEEISLHHQPISERKDTLQLTVGHEITSLDPAAAHSQMREAIIMQCVYQGLVKFKEGTWEVTPELAEDWTVSDDGLSVIFYLKSGVQFHHGFGELTAADVKFSFERMRGNHSSANAQQAWHVLKEVVVLSRYVAKLVLKHPAPHLFTSVLPMDVGLILSRKAVEQMGQTRHAVNPIGTGPYAFKSFQPRETIELELFDKYKGTPPLTRRLIFRLDTHAFNFPYRFSQGKLDVALFPNVNPQLLKSIPQVNCFETDSMQFWWLGLMTHKPPFNSPAARRAVGLALDRKRFLEIGLFGATPLNAPLPYGVEGHWADAPEIPYNPAEARRLLAEAGVAPGTKISLAADPAGLDIAALEVIRANLTDIGLTVTFDFRNRQALLDHINQGDSEMYLFFYSTAIGAYETLRWFTGDQYYNLSKWRNEDYAALVEKIGREPDAERRRQMIIEAQKIIVDDAWGVWLGQGRCSIVYRDNIDIGLTRPDGFLNPWTMKKI